MITTVNKNDLIALGFSEGTSRNIIRNGKLLLVKRGFEVYKNKRIGTIPSTIVSEMLGIDLQFNLEKEVKNGNTKIKK